VKGGFDLDVIMASAPFLLKGMGISLQLTALAVLGGILAGTMLALMRLSRFMPLSMLAGGYVNFLRSMPLILVIFWFYILVPKAIGRSIDSFFAVLIAFILFEAAYYCEIIRAGIASVRQGQINASLALGMTRLQAMRHVVLPQALRNMLPVLITQSIVMFQDTSLVYVVGLRDFLTSADVVANSKNRPIEMFVTVALVYLVICLLGSRLAGRLKRGYAL
jgi:glutamate/aspartate transport system permease protein